MAEDFNKLSPEQIKKLADTIADATDLTVMQEEIIKRVLTGETEIGKLRIAYLDRYFDTYSKGLDLVAKKYSKLSENYLLLDNKVNKSLASFKIDQTSYENLGQGTSKNNTAYKKNKKRSSSGKKAGGVEVSNYIEDDTRAHLTTVKEFTETITEETVKSFKRLADETERTSKELWKSRAQREVAIEAERDERDKYAKRRTEERIKLHKELARLEKDLEESNLDLYNLRHQTTEDEEDLVTKIRLLQRQELNDAEISAQKRQNNLIAQMQYADGD